MNENSYNIQSYIYKRELKKFKISPKLFRKIKRRIEIIWNETKPNKCELQIRKKGETALINSRYDGFESDIIQIGMSNEFGIYHKLVSLGLFNSDIITLISFSTYHEIGHNKHNERQQIKNERKILRLKAIQLILNGDIHEGLKFANLVWDKTYEIEQWAWDYARQYVKKEKEIDFFNLVDFCMTGHKNFWFQYVHNLISNIEKRAN